MFLVSISKIYKDKKNDIIKPCYFAVSDFRFLVFISKTHYLFFESNVKFRNFEGISRSFLYMTINIVHPEGLSVVKTAPAR